MKRSLTIGCVLLVGGGVTNCGGSAEMGSTIGDEQGQQAGAGAAGGFTGTIDRGGAGPYVGVPVTPAGAGGIYIGAVGVGGAGGSVGGVGSVMGTVPSVGAAGASGGDWGVGAGAGGWDAVGTAGASGESSSSEEPPAVGVARQGGSGGWVGIPPK